MTPSPAVRRLRLEVKGLVQGVGFRPFAYRLARELELEGWVVNDTRGVFVEVEGDEEATLEFRRRLEAEAPPRARIEAVSSAWLAPAGYADFAIRESDEGGRKSVPVLPDSAPCARCLAEIRDPADRRFGYPFANCTDCGPRFTIVVDLPYDRPNTTMCGFALCPDCRREYDDPADRRFHAQPVACPACGPRVALRAASGETLAEDGPALVAAAAALARGSIVALKGLGGYQLLVDATDAAAVARLRERKHRFEKPFALLVRDLEAARALCEVPPEAAAALTSAETPILLLRRLPGAAVCDGVAPRNSFLGVMLPATPLHHLLVERAPYPLVCTSGNLSDEPICIGEAEAFRRLGAIADLFLTHDRPIARHVDDSVGWIVGRELRLLRRARGFAPAPIRIGRPIPPILAVGAHQKSTVALGLDERVFVSQHVGDLETAEAIAAFERVVADFLRLYEAVPVAIAHDLHPDYVSTRWARDAAAGGAGLRSLEGVPLVPVQHHHAHLAACLAENGDPGPALGVAWDGTGYGTDGTIWGGEFLLGDASGFRRVASLRPFALPGGEAAVREPRRTGVVLLSQVLAEGAASARDVPCVAAFREAEFAAIASMLRAGVRCPVTTSAGRLFDGAAAILGIRQVTSFEGQAAMELEHALDVGETGAYPVVLDEGDLPTLDWRPTLAALLDDARRGAPVGVASARFHNALVDGIVLVARHVGAPRVALAGGCFQNRALTERASERLAGAGFDVLLHRQVPPNDGSISLGQAAVAASALSRVS